MFDVFVKRNLLYQKPVRTMIQLLTFILAFQFVACATLFKGSKQNIHFQVQGTDRANLSLFELEKNNKLKKVTSAKSELSYELKTGNGYFKKASYKVKAKQGNRKVEKMIEPTMNWTWYVVANLLVGGPITGMVGYLIVDPYTGAMWNYKVDKDNKIILDFEKESVHADKSDPEENSCEFFTQKVTLKNKTVLENVVMGVMPDYVAIFTREGKTWVYPKSEVQGAENLSGSEKEGSETSCDFFHQKVSLKKGEVVEEAITAITAKFVVVLTKEGKVLVYPKAEVQGISNKVE